MFSILPGFSPKRINKLISGYYRGQSSPNKPEKLSWKESHSKSILGDSYTKEIAELCPNVFNFDKDEKIQWQHLEAFQKFIMTLDSKEDVKSYIKALYLMILEVFLSNR